MAFQQENAKFKCFKCKELHKTFSMLESPFCPFEVPMDLATYKSKFMVKTQEANGEQLADADKRAAKRTKDENVKVCYAKVCYNCMQKRDTGSAHCLPWRFASGAVAGVGGSKRPARQRSPSGDRTQTCPCV